MRDDLAHLTPEALAQLTNAGLVKRAVRELAGGLRPQLVLDEMQTLLARFDDGTECTLPHGTTLQNARCSCGAAGVCRHRLIAVLAWRERAAQETPGAAPTPLREVARVSDEELASLIPAALLLAAERARNEGLVIDISRRGAGEACDTARLPSATVRFWAGGAVEAARCDCVAKSACEHVALGVWAFRAALENPGDEAKLSVRLGPPGHRHRIDVASFDTAVLALLQHGVVHGSAALAQGLTAARAAAADAAWLGLLMADLDTWAEAYAQRSALYDAADGVDLIAELGLRLAAGRLPGHAGAVLGVGQAGETALDRLRLMSLGARTRRDGERRLTTLVLADIDTGTRLVLRHGWGVPEAREGDEAQLRAAERVAPGVLLDAMAHGQLLAQQAARRADGSIRLARSRSSQNSVLPQTGDWSQLSAPLRFARVAELRDEAQLHANAALQPRHAARRLVVFSPSQVEGVRYDANEQCLFAALADEAGETLLLHRTYERHTPHALDAIAAALDGRCGVLRHVAGTLDWQDGLPRIEPWALACDRLVVPDMASRIGALAAVPLGRLPEFGGDACTQALEGVRQHLATCLHQGARRLPGRWFREGDRLQRSLAGLGLQALAERISQCQSAFEQGGPTIHSAQGFVSLAAMLQLHKDAVEKLRSAKPG